MREMLPSFILLFVPASVWGTGCGPQVDCKALSRRIEKCGPEVYRALQPPAVEFIEKLASSKGGLTEDARQQVDARWKVELHRLVTAFASDLDKKCRKEKGRFRESSKLKTCLEKHKDCRKFAECFQKAAKIK